MPNPGWYAPHAPPVHPGILATQNVPSAPIKIIEYPRT